MRTLLREFRDFVGKGNVVDLAVGIVLGAAMATILKSFVDELVVPLTGLLGKVDFANRYLVLRGDVPDGTPLAEARKMIGVVVLGYGQFLTVLLNTLLLAFVVFLVVRSVNKLRARMSRETQPAAAPPADIALLTEIRDLLKQRR